MKLALFYILPMNSNVSDINVQLAYLKYEMEEGSDFMNAWKEIKNSNTLQEATNIFLVKVEDPKVHNLNVRMNYSNQFITH